MALLINVGAASLIIMSVWGVGANMLLYLAGLQGIPTSSTKPPP